MTDKEMANKFSLGFLTAFRQGLKSLGLKIKENEQ